jgi:hypothetical protein
VVRNGFVLFLRSSSVSISSNLKLFSHQFLKVIKNVTSRIIRSASDLATSPQMLMHLKVYNLSFWEGFTSQWHDCQSFFQKQTFKLLAVATVVFNVRLLQAVAFSNKLRWFEPTKVITLKTQPHAKTHAENACRNASLTIKFLRKE